MPHWLKIDESKIKHALYIVDHGIHVIKAVHHKVPPIPNFLPEFIYLVQRFFWTTNQKISRLGTICEIHVVTILLNFETVIK